MQEDEKIDHSKYDDISGAEELELSRRLLAGDKQARDILVHSLMHDVVKIAQEYISVSSLPILGLIREGKLGLYAAAKKYDASKGEKFCTFAYLCIREAIENAIEKEKAKHAGLPEVCCIGD